MGQRMTILARYDQVAPACDFIAQAAARAGFDDDAVFQVQLACDEACTNVIEHAYQEEEGEIEVGYMVKAGKFVITIRDFGLRFDPSTVPEPLVFSGQPVDIDALEVGGLGLHFMRKLMDEITFTFDQKKGNLLVMTKRLPK